jgi:biopolymer transport protein ExbD
VKLESQLVLTPRFLHVVPFLGVVMLLLTFFLLGSSMVMQSGIRVQPPASRSLLEPMPQAQVITVTAGREPRVYWNDRPVTFGELDKALSEARQKSRQVLIRADELAAYGWVIKVSQLALDRGYDVVHATVPDESHESLSIP